MLPRMGKLWPAISLSRLVLALCGYLMIERSLDVESMAVWNHHCANLVAVVKEWEKVQLGPGHALSICQIAAGELHREKERGIGNLPHDAGVTRPTCPIETKLRRPRLGSLFCHPFVQDAVRVA